MSFGNTSALFQSDLVMYDHQTGSYWFQVAGEAVVGTLTGARLALLPSTTITWGEWRKLFPETRLLTGTTQNPRMFGASRYARGLGTGFQDRINDRNFVFPVDEGLLDDRLPAGEIVLVVEVGEGATAFPLGLIGDGAVNHAVGGQPVVVFSLAGNRASVAYSREVDGRILSFEYRKGQPENQQGAQQGFIDRETGSVWDTGGLAVRGALEGSQLRQLNTRRSFYFSVVIAFPDVDVYLP